MLIELLLSGVIPATRKETDTWSKGYCAFSSFPDEKIDYFFSGLPNISLSFQNCYLLLVAILTDDSSPFLRHKNITSLQGLA